MLTLYHSQPTGNSYKVRLLLSILQIPYTAVEIDIFNGENKRATYQRINPLGKAPALSLEDGSILTESAPEGGFDLSKYPGVQQWLGGIEKRVGYVPLMQTP